MLLFVPPTWEARLHPPTNYRGELRSGHAFMLPFPLTPVLLSDPTDVHKGCRTMWPQVQTKQNGPKSILRPRKMSPVSVAITFYVSNGNSGILQVL